MKDIVSLVHKVLSGKANGSEQQNLEDWIAESQENREEFENIKLLWEYSSEDNNLSRGDNNGFEKIRRRVLQQHRRKRRMLYSLSTVILLIAVVICLLLLRDIWFGD